MSALFILIGASLLVAVGFLIAFIWSVRDGQYEDEYTPAIRMLFDNDTKTQNETQKKLPVNKRSLYKKNKLVSKKQK